MPFSEENVLDFVKWLEKSYFVERALGRIEKLLAPEFMMVGTGRREVCYDMPQMRFLLQQEQSGFHDTFLVLSAHYSVRTLTPEVFSVCGVLVVRENNESCEMLDLPGPRYDHFARGAGMSAAFAAAFVAAQSRPG